MQHLIKHILAIVSHTIGAHFRRLTILPALWDAGSCCSITCFEQLCHRCMFTMSTICLPARALTGRSLSLGVKQLSLLRALWCSTFDDPGLLSALLPWHYFWSEGQHGGVRWSLCARDICFRGWFLRSAFMPSSWFTCPCFPRLSQDPACEMCHVPAIVAANFAHPLQNTSRDL